MRPALWLLLGTVGAVLLIVCVNVGNLMLLRTGGRLREAGVRLALGASSQRLFGLALTEASRWVVCARHKSGPINGQELDRAPLAAPIPILYFTSPLGLVFTTMTK